MITLDSTLVNVLTGKTEKMTTAAGGSDPSLHSLKLAWLFPVEKQLYTVHKCLAIEHNLRHTFRPLFKICIS